VTKRPHRYYGTHDPHFITSSCYRRQPELDSAWRRDSFVKILEETRRKYRFVVYRFFHHIFSVPPSQTCTTIGAMIHRRCSIEKCARLQRWTYFRLRIFTALSQHMAPASTPATARQSSKSAAKSNVLNILPLTTLLSSTSLIL